MRFSFFNLIFILYWSIVDLQCCISGIQQSDSLTYVHISILLQIVFPCRLLQNTEEFPVLYSRFLLIIYFIHCSEFCKENALVIANTLFQQHKKRLYTWTSPDDQHQNQIDYILCSQRWRSSIKSAETRPGADCGSD